MYHTSTTHVLPRDMYCQEVLKHTRFDAVCCSVLQGHIDTGSHGCPGGCVAVCCRVLQRVAVCCSGGWQIDMRPGGCAGGAISGARQPFRCLCQVSMCQFVACANVSVANA